MTVIPGPYLLHPRCPTTAGKMDTQLLNYWDLAKMFQARTKLSNEISHNKVITLVNKYRRTLQRQNNCLSKQIKRTRVKNKKNVLTKRQQFTDTKTPQRTKDATPPPPSRPLPLPPPHSPPTHTDTHKDTTTIPQLCLYYHDSREKNIYRTIFSKIYILVLKKYPHEDICRKVVVSCGLFFGC